MKAKFMRFVRSYVTMDLRLTAEQEWLRDIKRKALRHEVLKHTAGKRSVFHVSNEWKLV